jgi:hypothetical protein
MEKLIHFLNDLVGLSGEKQIFIIAILAIAVVALALYVVLMALGG